jgi:hypothetical protein
MDAGKKAVIRVRFGSTSDRLHFWNGPVGLTPKEIEVLGALLDSDGELCGKENRKLACAALGMSPVVLNTYIQRLKEKKAVTSSKGIFTLNRIFHASDRVEVIVLG